MSPLARVARQSAGISANAFRASSSQAGPSKPAPPVKNPKRLPKAVLRDLVKLHHTASTFMHDPSQIPDGFQAAFRAAAPKQLPYSDFLGSAGGRAPALNEEDSFESVDQPVATFGRTKSMWSDKGASSSSVPSTEREKQVREALFGTYERGPGESVRPGLEGVEEWLSTSGISVEQVAREWEERHNEVALGSTREPLRETEDGQ